MSYFVRLAPSPLDPSGSPKSSPFPAPGWGRVATARGVRGLGTIGIETTAPGVEDWSKTPLTGNVQFPDAKSARNSLWAFGWESDEVLVKTQEDALNVAESIGKAAAKKGWYLAILGVVVGPGEDLAQSVEVVFDWSEVQAHTVGGEKRWDIVNQGLSDMGAKKPVDYVRLLRLTDDKYLFFGPRGGFAPVFVGDSGTKTAGSTKAAGNPNREQFIGGTCLECPEKKGAPLPSILSPDSGKAKPKGTDQPVPKVEKREETDEDQQDTLIMNAAAAAACAVASFLVIKMLAGDK